MIETVYGMGRTNGLRFVVSVQRHKSLMIDVQFYHGKQIVFIQIH